MDEVRHRLQTLSAQLLFEKKLSASDVRGGQPKGDRVALHKARGRAAVAFVVWETGGRSLARLLPALSTHSGSARPTHAPQQHSERHLPPLAAPEGVPLQVTDTCLESGTPSSTAAAPAGPAAGEWGGWMLQRVAAVAAAGIAE